MKPRLRWPYLESAIAGNGALHSGSFRLTFSGGRKPRTTN